jgi:hypothetical protein
MPFFVVPVAKERVPKVFISVMIFNDDKREENYFTCLNLDNCNYK